MCSQFSAIKSLQSNRGLRRKRGQYFIKNKTNNKYKKPTKSTYNYSAKSKHDKKYVWARNKKTIRFVLSGLIISSICFYFISGFGLQVIEQNARKEKEIKSNIASNTSKQSDRWIYSMCLKTGDEYYKSKKYKSAQSEFIVALNIYPQSIKANLGLTKTLMKRCITENTLCPEAFAYYNRFIDSKLLTPLETSELKLLMEQNEAIAYLD